MTIKEQLTETAIYIASEYPEIEAVVPSEQLYAIKSSYDGVSAACDDCHLIIQVLRKKLGISQEDLTSLWEKTLNSSSEKDRSL